MSNFNVDGYVGKRVIVETHGTDPYLSGGELSVRVDGEEAIVQRIDRLRDGGTTIIHTTKGTVIFPRGLGEDRTPLFDGEPINEF